MLNLTATLTTRSGKSSRGILNIEEIPLTKRILKSLLLGLLILICAICSIAIPILHFILPPLLLLLSLYVGVSTFRQKARIHSGQGKCPECSAEFMILGRNLKFPFYDNCEGCRREIKIQGDTDK